MRITVSHTKSKEEVRKAIDRSFDDLFGGIGTIPVQFVNRQKSWNADLLTFSFTAKMGLLNTPIRGTVLVTDRDVTVDADLGLLEKLVSSQGTQATMERQIRGLLR